MMFLSIALISLLRQPRPPNVLNPPVTIEVKQDIEVTREVSGQLRGKLYALPLGAEPFWIRKGQRFEMLEELGEGECRIRFEGKSISRRPARGLRDSPTIRRTSFRS